MATPFAKPQVVFKRPDGRQWVVDADLADSPQAQKYAADNGFVRQPGTQAGAPAGPSAGATSAVTGKTTPVVTNRSVAAPPKHVYVDKFGKEVAVDAKTGSGILPGIGSSLTSDPPGPGFERKNGLGVATAQAAAQGVTGSFADDAVAGLLGPVSYLTRDNPNETYSGAQNRATKWTEKWFDDHAAENPQAAPAQFAGSLFMPNPLGLFRGAVPAARATLPVGPLTPKADKVMNYLEALTGNGLSHIPSRPGAMAVQSAKAGAYTAAERLGSQPIGQKDPVEAVTTGGEGAAFSLPLQLLPIPGGTGFGRLLQTPNAQRLHPDPNNPFARTEPLHGPQGVGEWLDPRRQADLAGTFLNEEALREAGGAARVASLGGSLGTLQNALDARPQFGTDAPALGNSLNSYKIPKSFLPENKVTLGSPKSWVQWLRENVPSSKAIFGTGEVPLLPPSTNNARAGVVFDNAVEAANQRIGLADATVPPVDVNDAFRAARAGVDQAASLHGVPAEDLGRVGRILEDSRSKFPTEVETRAVTVHGDAGGYPAVPGVASYEELLAAGYSPVQARGMLFGTEARGAPIKSFPTEVPPQTVPLAGTPGGYLRPGETVPVPVPEAAKWTTGPQVNVGPGAGARPGSRPGTSTQTAHRNANPDTVPQELPPTYVQPGPPLGTIERPGYTTYVNAPNANPPPRTVLAPFPAPAPVPAGEVRQKLGGTLRREADYRGLEKAGSNSAIGAASGQTALGRFLDEHWAGSHWDDIEGAVVPNLSKEELAAAREAKDLATTAHAGMDINNPIRGATNAPRTLGGEVTAGAMGTAAGAAGGPAAAILARNASRALEKQSPIFPKRAGFNTRLAEGLEGQGINTAWQTAGTVGRGVRLLPGRLNSAIISDAESDGPIMSIDPNAGPWNTALQRFLGTANPYNWAEVEKRAFNKNNPSK